MTSTHTADRTGARVRPLAPLAGALLFAAAYLLLSPVVSLLGAGPAPLPDAPAEDIAAFARANPGVSIATAVMQTLSIIGLVIVITGQTTRVAGPRRRRVTIAAGALAVAGMAVTNITLVSSTLLAPNLTDETIAVFRQVSFFAGGVVHVVALGVFVLLVTQSRSWTRPVRVFGIIAAVPAVLSILSLAWYYASVALPVGRVLCMVALIIAGVSLLRRKSPVAAG